MNFTNKLKYDDFTAFPAFWQVDKNSRICYDDIDIFDKNYMQINKKLLFFISIVVLFGAFTLNAQAAKKVTAKKTPKKAKTTVVVKKITPPKKAIVKPAVKPTIKPADKSVKTPVLTTTTTVKTSTSTSSVPKPTINTTTDIIIKPPVTSTASTTNIISYPWHDNILATQFYIGETGLSGTTAWDCHAVNHYGGVDSPFGRNGYLPAFTPKENSFYLALPYTDIGPDGAHKKDIPWYDVKLDTGDGYSFVKNRWVEMKRDDKICYGQWEDSLTPDILDPTTGKRIGYGKSNHFDYVFGSATTTHPGIDISPALSDCLGMRDPSDTKYGHADAPISWKFVGDSDVPAGAWKNIITVTPVSWENCN